MASTPPVRATAAAMLLASGIRVSGSTSASTGVSPAWTMAWTAPQKVIDRAEHLRARRQSQRAQRQLDRRGAGGDGDGVLGPDPGGELALERGSPLAQW